MFYAIDYNTDKLSIKGAPTADTLNSKPAPEGMERVIINNEEELGALDPALILRIANFKTKGAALTELPAISDVWAMLSPPPRKKKNSEKNAYQELTAPASDAISSSPEGTPPADDNKETKMAKTAKKAKGGKAKAKTAAKTARKANGNGLPREGSKAAKLLALISRPGGATFAEMQKATNWKEMRGTALVLARKAGKTLTMIKEEGKQPRWAAK